MIVEMQTPLRFSSLGLANVCVRYIRQADPDPFFRVLTDSEYLKPV
jgi:hypothetical protein